MWSFYDARKIVIPGEHSHRRCECEGRGPRCWKLLGHEKNTLEFAFDIAVLSGSGSPSPRAALRRSAGDDSQRISTATAVASPPPMQREATPRLSFLRCKAFNSVTIMRAPLAPMG